MYRKSFWRVRFILSLFLLVVVLSVQLGSVAGAILVLAAIFVVVCLEKKKSSNANGFIQLENLDNEREAVSQL